MMRRGCRAILVGVQTQSVSDAEMLRSLAELRRLAETLGHAVDEHPVTQRRAAMGPRVLGKGKLEELARAREKSLPEEEVALLVDTDRLSRTQERGLAEATRATAVMDRSRIILAIFKQHAQTRAAKLQVEMAQLMYDGPTGVRSTDIGGGGKGAGESQSELSARQTRDRLAFLRKELESIEKESATRRERRESSPKVAIVGYTNAGKSSLMRSLTGSDVLVEDKLFATLSTTSRVLRNPDDWQKDCVPRVLVSDTVGFIRKLPTELVASFAATLAEANEADVLLHVVDASDPDKVAQMQVTDEVLKKIGAGGERLLILNKCDMVDDKARLMQEFPQGMLVSAHNTEDMKRVANRVLKLLEKEMVEKQLLLRIDDPKRGMLLGKIRGTCRVLEQIEDYDNQGSTWLRFLAPKHLQKM